MQLKNVFKAAVQELHKAKVPFAVAGGLAADLYRDQPRLTMDIDISIYMKTHALQNARKILKTIGLDAGIVREADLAGGPLFAIKKGNTKACMVVGRQESNPDATGVDFILPTLPWVKNAIQRARDNHVDFGFGPVPALTLEDVILSKLWALNTARLRAKDLDDLQSIFDANHDIDIPYLSGQMHRFEIKIPKQAKPFLPDLILKL